MLMPLLELPEPLPLPLPDPPKKPPAKKPPMKPPPPEPPITPELVEPLALDETTGNWLRGGGSGALGVMMTWAAPWLVVVVTVRRTTRRGAATRRTVRRTTRFFTIVCCCTTRGLATRSVTYTPLPPITAPPQAQAQSLARAMRTDIWTHSFVAGVAAPHGIVSSFPRSQ